MNQTYSPDSPKLQRVLLSALLVLATIALVRFGFTQNRPVLGLLIALIAAVIWLIGKPESLFCFVLFAENARLLIPGLTATLGVSEAFQVLLIGWAILDVSLRHQDRPYSYRSNADRWLILFALNILMIMLVRGSGFALLGSTVYGGTAYVSMILSMAFYFAATRITLTAQHVERLIWIVMIGSFIPVFVQIAIYLSPSAFYGLTAIVRVQAEQLLEEQATEGEGVARWTTFSLAAYALIPMAYVIWRRRSIRFVLILLAFVLVGFTGSRSRIFQVGVLVFLSSVYFSNNRSRAIVMWALIGLLSLGFLMITAPMLPRAMQRAVSFIPFLPVDTAIAERAAYSSNWRFELWKNYCIPNIPKYLLIGRGIAHDIMGFAWLQSSWYGSSEFFYFMGRYHSGPLTLLLDLGLPGTICFTVFFLMVVKDSWQTVRRYAARQQSLVARYYIYLTISMSYEVFNYYFIFGDIRSSLFRMLLIATQLRILKKAFLVNYAQPNVDRTLNNMERASVPPAIVRHTL